MDNLEGENMETQCSVLCYKIDLFFNKCVLAIEVDEIWHSNRNEIYETQRQKATEEELNCKFIRINLDEQNFSISRAKKKIFRHIKEANEKSLVKKISTRLLT